MPKQIAIDPREMRRPGVLRAPEIPVNAYVPDPAAEAARYGRENLVHIYRDMVYIREFESMLDQIKRQRAFEGIEYIHRGPAHLSIGQEAVAVGMAYHLGPEDLIFGSHRSHGEVLAKSFVAIRRLEEESLQAIMEEYLDGEILRVAETLPHRDLRDLALVYVLYGTLAEIFGKATGFNRGLGGSMHVFFPPFGIMPNNAIVGGSADIAVGAALFKRVNRRPGIVVANIGDSAIACGPVWEAMNLAAMDQYRLLWPQEVRGAPPVLFHFVDNFYGMGGQPYGETLGMGILARAGLAVNPEAMHAERVDGFNPLAVADAFARKRPILEEGRGPVLLDTITYRFVGHSPSDASAYRTREEVEWWRQQDPLVTFRDYLLEHGHATAQELDALQAEFHERLVHVLEAAVDPQRSPRLDLGTGILDRLMFSHGLRDRLDDRPPEVLIPKEATRWRETTAKFRFGLDPEGNPRPRMRCVTYAEALFEAMLHRFYEDPTMIAFGEENRDWGGAFGVYRGLTEALPYHRLFNTPIAEAAIVGAGVGYALSGGRAVVEIMYCDFMGRAGDELFNQMAKWQAMSGGVLEMPLVVRVSVGARYGAQHSQDWSALVAHIPGLKVYYPATPYDAKGMLNRALRGTDPVIFFESQRLYPEPEVLVPGGVPVDYYEVPEGEPAIRREGTDITLITLGPTLYRALEAAEILDRRYGVSAEVIDARFLVPLNYEPLVASVRKTNRVLLAGDACERGSYLHTIASNLAQRAFDWLDGPPVVVGARNWITPPPELEEDFFPQASWLVTAIHERILPLW